MIQRVQTLFLIGVIICMVALLFVPIWEKEAANTEKKERIELNSYSLKLYSDGNQQVRQNTIYIAIISIVIAGIALYEIFSYKNRIRQRMLGGFNSIVIILLLGVNFYIIYGTERFFEPTIQGKYHIGFFLILITLILNMLANRFILRDEKLVRSADRMRD